MGTHFHPRRKRTGFSRSSYNQSQAASQLAPQIPPPDAIELDLATIELLLGETTQGSTYRLYLQLLKLEALACIIHEVQQEFLVLPNLGK